MARTNFKSVDEYIATHPDEMQAILQRVRAAIRKAVPGAQEVISYQIPAYRLHGGTMRLRSKLGAGTVVRVTLPRDASKPRKKAAA